MDLAEAQRKAALRRAEEVRSKVSEELLEYVGERIPAVAKGGRPMALKFYPDPVLDTPCSEVTEFDQDLSDLIESMAVTMYLTGGVGLAANQVGVTKRVFICDARDLDANPDAKSDLRIFVNPKVIETSEDHEVIREGCLSFPGVRENISRPRSCTILAFDHKGQPFEEELFGWLARIAQHEIDHLDGKTWLDHMGDLQRRMSLKKAEKVRRTLVIEKRQAKKRNAKRGGTKKRRRKKRR